MNPADLFDRCLYISVQTDTNRINSRQNIAAVNQLEQWHRDEVIELFMSEAAHTEALVGGDARRSAKTFAHYFSETLAETPEEQELMRDIENTIFPGGAKDKSQLNDVEMKKQ